MKMTFRYLPLAVLIFISGIACLASKSSPLDTISTQLNPILAKSTTVSLSVTHDLYLNQILGLYSDGGNPSKLMDVCQYNHNLYAAGIQTSDIGFLSETSQVTVNSAVEGFVYKHIHCGSRYVFVITPEELVRIGVADHQVQRVAIGVDDDAYYLGSSYAESGGVFFVSYVGDGTHTPRVVMYDIETLTILHTFYITRSNMYVKNDGRIVAVNINGEGTVTFYNGTTYAEESSTFVTLFGQTAYDAATNQLWWYTNTQIKSLNLDSLEDFFSIQSATHSLPSVDGIVAGSRYAALICEECRDTRDRNETDYQQGAVVVFDAVTLSALFTQDIPYRHASVMMDPVTEEIIFTNNEEGSVTVLDVATQTTKIRDVANTPEWIGIDRHRNLLMVNRLGGSSLMYLDLEQSLIYEKTAPSEWPLGLSLHSDADRAIVWSHLGNAIEFYDITTTGVSLQRRVDLTGHIAKPDEDKLGDIAYDASLDKAYAAIPELNQLVSVNASDEVATFDLTPTSTTIKGAGLINLYADAQTHRLFVYEREAATIRVLNGETLVQESSFSAPEGWGDTHYTYSFFAHGRDLFIGPFAYSMDTLAQGTRFTTGGVVVGIDDDTQTTFLLGFDSTTEREYLYAFDSVTHALKDSLELNVELVTQGRGVYDAVGGYVYVLYPQESRVVQVSVY